MKALFREIWVNDRKAFLRILCLNIGAELLGGIGIVMLIPLLNMLNIGAADSGSMLATLAAPMAGWSYSARVVALLTMYILLVLFKALLNRTLSIRSSAFIENTTLRLRDRLYNAVARADWEQLAAHKSTDTINLFTAQCSQVTYGISEIIDLLASAVSAVVQLGIALAMNVPLTILVCLLGGAMLTLFKPLRKKSRDYGDELIQINRNFYAELQNQLSSIKEVRAYGVEEEHAERFREISASFKDAHLRYTRLYTVPQVVYSVAAALLIAGVYLVSTLALKVEIDRLVVLVYVFARLWPLFSGFQSRIQYIYSCVPAHEKLNAEIREMQPKQDRDEKLEDMEPHFEDWREVRFRHVFFTYHDAQEPILRDVSFSLGRGSITALLGRNGTGKTTIANLLLGFLNPGRGEISVDGEALNPQNVRKWRNQVGYVPQDPLILNASVRENLTRFHPGASEDEIVAALKKALAWELVSALPDGLDTQLGDRGIRLSGGERQRIVLARVLIGKPQLIILDEATSALDYESENEFREMIRSTSEGLTVLLIAHRLATIRMASQAVVLEEGTVCEQGPMAEMLSRSEGYLARMVSVE